MQTVNVIGGSGFIGTRLVRRLGANRHFKIKIIDKVPSKAFPSLYVLGDVRSVDELRAEVSDNGVIINLAAEHRDNVQPLSLYREVNVQGAKNICLIAEEKNVRSIIFTSTVAVYGFAPVGTDESGTIAPFNEYGHSKYEAEQIFRAWQAAEPNERKLVIVRPTVVFGEQNRGNVYNLLSHIASGRFVMVGHGKNRKSMAYVENLAAFLEYSIDFNPGVHIYNFIDKPDFTMNSLFRQLRRMLGKSNGLSFRIPFAAGFFIGKVFDLASTLTGKQYSISSIRVRKFCTDSVYETAIHKTGFVSPVSLENALERTMRYEFIESNENAEVFYTE